MKMPDSMFDGENIAEGIKPIHVSKKQKRAFAEIIIERQAQDDKWGADRKNHPLYWLAILVEEVGELSKAVIERDIHGMRKESKQIAAVSVAIMEAMDYCEEVLHDEIRRGKGTGDESRP